MVTRGVAFPLNSYNNTFPIIGSLCDMSAVPMCEVTPHDPCLNVLTIEALDCHVYAAKETAA